MIPPLTIEPPRRGAGLPREASGRSGRFYRAVPRLGQQAYASQGIFELYRRMAEKLKPPEPIYVRLKVPPGIGAVQTLSGRRITIGEDRIVEMSAEDANCLIRAGWTKLAEWSADEAA